MIIFFYVNVEELNDILTINGYTEVDRYDDIDELQFNKEYYDGHGDDEIEEEENNSD